MPISLPSASETYRAKAIVGSQPFFARWCSALAVAVTISLGMGGEVVGQNYGGVTTDLGDMRSIVGTAVADYYSAAPANTGRFQVPVVQVSPAPQAIPMQIVDPAPATPGCECTQCVPTQACEAPAKKAAPKANPCAKSHKPLFYDNVFTYLDNEDYEGVCLGDAFKKIGPKGNIDIGGQIRMRYHHEVGMGQQAGETRFEDTTNDFLLSRLRLYTDWKITDRLRLFTEGIYADVLTSNPEYIPRGIDQNFGDLLNFFLDVQVTDNTIARVGRQELLFGAQRLVSPLDWSNTRRTFDGARLISTFEDWKVHMFYSQVVLVEPNDFDNSDKDQELYGTYATYSGMENATLDFYALGYRNTKGSADKSIVTFGSRLDGKKDKWLYEFEGMVQSGAFLAPLSDINAYAATAGLGRQFDGCWKPKVFLYYDYASGNRLNGSTQNFDDLFPLGHKYLGFIDAVKRSNVMSPNALLTVNPAKRLSLLLWYLNFTATERNDDISSLGGTPAQDPTLADFGNELDFVATFKASARTNVLAGYSHLWAGDKILSGLDADFFYLQWQTNF